MSGVSTAHSERGDLVGSIVAYEHVSDGVKQRFRGRDTVVESTMSVVVSHTQKQSSTRFDGILTAVRQCIQTRQNASHCEGFWDHTLATT